MFHLMFVLLTSSHAISCDDAARAAVGANDVRREFLDSAEAAAAASFWSSFVQGAEVEDDPELREYVMAFWSPILNDTLASVYDEDVTEVVSTALQEHMSCKDLKKAAKKLKKSDTFLTGDATNDRDVAMGKAMTTLMANDRFTQAVATKMMKAAEGKKDAFVQYMMARDK